MGVRTGRGVGVVTFGAATNGVPTGVGTSWIAGFGVVGPLAVIELNSAGAGLGWVPTVTVVCEKAGDADAREMTTAKEHRPHSTRETDDIMNSGLVFV